MVCEHSMLSMTIRTNEISLFHFNNPLLSKYKRKRPNVSTESPPHKRACFHRDLLFLFPFNRLVCIFVIRFVQAFVTRIFYLFDFFIFARLAVFIEVYFSVIVVIHLTPPVTPALHNGLKICRLPELHRLTVNMPFFQSCPERPNRTDEYQDRR